MKLTSKLLLFVLIFALVPLVVSAQEPPPPPPPPPDNPAWAPGGPGPQGPGPMPFQRGFRRGPGMGRGMREGMPGLMEMGDRMREQLGLTAEQETQLRQRHLDFAKSQIRAQADLRVKQLELGELLRADKADRVAIDRKLREIIEAQFVERKAAIDHQLAVREILTPEQREKLRQLPREMRKQRMRPGPEGMGPRPEGQMQPRRPRQTPPPQIEPQPESEPDFFLLFGHNTPAVPSPPAHEK